MNSWTSSEMTSNYYVPRRSGGSGSDGRLGDVRVDQSYKGGHLFRRRE